jgi:hydroxyacylglutathione hydrolase
MLFERIESEGLAHYSYLIGDGNQAAVIDPRRDCEVYVERAHKSGFRIEQILETHRNEDYVIGSLELSLRTGAEIWHADSELDYRYGKAAEDGQVWKIGRLRLEAISSPGHTPGSISYLLHDPEGAPWILFSGDALFAGDVGRVDLLGMDLAEEMAGRLFETIFKRFLLLGDGVILCPAHGTGSVCGTAIAERPWTTVGIEKEHNPKLHNTEERDFVADVARELERPPYFRRMEKLNIEGAPLLGSLPIPRPLPPKEFASLTENALVLDTRSELSFGAAHVPGALSIWLKGLASFAGWFLPYDGPILLVCEENDPEEATRILIRLGYDEIAGYLAGGMLAWHMSGQKSSSIRTVTVQELCRLLDRNEPAWILDVRSFEELEKGGRIPGAWQIHVTLLPERMDEVPRDQRIYIFCGSGMRSMIAASMMRRQGYEDLVVVLGGLSGWKSVTCPILRRAE